MKNNIIICFKSGKGESYITSVVDFNFKEIEISGDETDEIENVFSREIFRNDHSDINYYGRIVIENWVNLFFKADTDKFDAFKEKIKKQQKHFAIINQ